MCRFGQVSRRAVGKETFRAKFSGAVRRAGRRLLAFAYPIRPVRCGGGGTVPLPCAFWAGLKDPDRPGRVGENAGDEEEEWRDWWRGVDSGASYGSGSCVKAGELFFSELVEVMVIRCVCIVAFILYGYIFCIEFRDFKISTFITEGLQYNFKYSLITCNKYFCSIYNIFGPFNAPAFFSTHLTIFHH